MNRRFGFATLVVFLTFFTPRIFGAAAYINTDGAGYWFERTSRFWDGVKSGDLAKTIPAPHPGVTLAWLAGASLRAAHAVGWLDTLPSETAPQTKVAALPVVTFPVVLITSLFGTLLFVLFTRATRSLLGGLAAVAFLAVDPWWISQSRQFHLDALAISFSFVGLLLYPFERIGRWRLRTGLAAALMALGVLTRFSAGLVPAVLVAYQLIRRDTVSRAARLQQVALAAAIGVVVIALLWPVVFVRPGMTYGTIREGVGWALNDVDLPYTLGLPGWLEWSVDPLVLLTRVPLIVLALVVVALAVRRWRGMTELERRLLLVGGAYFAIIWYATKSLDRYLLPTVVVLDILAGLALVTLFQKLARWRRLLAVVLGGTLLFFTFEIVRLHPYESLARNSLFRVLYPKLVGKSEAMTLGWGEGLREAAAYVNAQPGSPTLAAWYQDATAVFLNTTPISLMDAPLADFVLVYQNQLVRNYVPAVGQAFLASGQPPVFSATINGQGIVWVYKTPDSLRQAHPPLRKFRDTGNLTPDEIRQLLDARGTVQRELTQ